MITILANSLVPIFAGLLLGFFAGRRGAVDNHDVRSLITFLMSFSLPCSLFVAIALTPREVLWRQASPALVLALVYMAAFAVTYFASTRVARAGSGPSAALALTVGFPNAAAIALPLLAAVYGQASSVTVAVAIAVGSMTVTPATLAILENSSGQAHSGGVWGSIGRALKKPVFWAPLLAVVAAVASIHMH